MTDPPRRQSVLSQRRASFSASYRHGSIAEARKSIGGGLEAVVITGGTFGDIDEKLRDRYAPIETYEGYHRYDPDFSWTAEEENKVVKKVIYPLCVKGTELDPFSC
jgi:hypothetical protein